MKKYYYLNIQKTERHKMQKTTNPPKDTISIENQ